MAKKHKEKGNRYERKIARLLSEWWTGKSDVLIFWRTHGSGTMGPRVTQEAGDMMAIHKEGETFLKKFSVECKNWSQCNLFDLFTRTKTSVFRTWWNKACKEAQGRIPLLIFKVGRYPDMIALPVDIFPKLGLQPDITINMLNCGITLLNNFTTEEVKRRIKRLRWKSKS